MTCAWCEYSTSQLFDSLCQYCVFHGHTVAQAALRAEWRRQQTDLAGDGGLQGNALWAAYWAWDKEKTMRRQIAVSRFDPPIPEEWKERGAILMSKFPDDLADECWCHPDVDYPLAGGIGTLSSDGFGLRFVAGRHWSGFFLEGKVAAKASRGCCEEDIPLIKAYSDKVRYALEHAGQNNHQLVDSALHEQAETAGAPEGDLARPAIQ